MDYHWQVSILFYFINILTVGCLTLKGKNVSISPGPLARLAELASSLSDRSIVVCLEHNEAYENSFFLGNIYFSL